MDRDEAVAVMQQNSADLKHQAKPARMSPKNMLYDDLEQLERQLISALYSVWRAMGKERRIIKLQ